MPRKDRPSPLRAVALRPAWVMLALMLAVVSVAALPATPAEAASARVAADGDCLNLRQSPGLGGAVISCLPDGSAITTISGQAATADGLQWQQVRVGTGAAGWVAARYLAVAADAPAAAATEAPAIAIAQALAAPPPGGLTIGVSGTSSLAALVAAQPFPVAGITVIDPATQRSLAFIPGAPASVSSLDDTTLRPGSIVMIRRQGELAALDIQPATAAAGTSTTTPRVLPVPPRGGLTQGPAGTRDVAALIAAQPFAVESVMALDVPSQRWLSYTPGAPDASNTLDTRTLRPETVVTVRRSATLPDPPPVATPAATPAVSGAIPGGAAPITYYFCTPGSNPAGLGDGGGFCGAMRSGAPVHAGAASCAAANFGQRFRIVGDPTDRIYTCEDTGGGVHNNHRDIWFDSSDDALAWWLRTAPGGTALIEVLPYLY